MQQTCGCGVLRHLPRKGEGCSIEEAPGGLVAPVMWGLFIGAQHVGDSSDVNNTLPVHSHYGLVGTCIWQWDRLVLLDLFRLLTTSKMQGFDHFAHEAGKVSFGIRRVLPPDHVVRVEGQVVADEHPASDGDANWKLLLVAVSEADHVGVVTVGRSQRQDTEVVHPVGCDCMMLFEQFVAEKAERVADHIHHRVVRYRDMARRGIWCWKQAEGIEIDGFAASVQHEGHGYLHVSGEGRMPIEQALQGSSGEERSKLRIRSCRILP
jgi:hypothetical protein